MAHIELHGAHNVRDLGDHATVDNRKIAPGVLFRADSLSNLNDADVDVVRGLGLRTVIDFRGPDEVSHMGVDRLPPEVEAVALPIGGADVSALVRSIVVGRNPSEQHTLLGDGKAAELMRGLHRKFVADAEFRKAFGRAWAIIADSQRRPVLFHCTAGKDRTGWMSAIVLTTLGMAPEQVMGDYLRTNEYVWPTYRRWIHTLVTTGRIADADLVRPLLYQDESYLNAAFGEVTDRYGTFERFLTDGLAVHMAQVERLRDELLV